jgi:hypothetical protein
MEASVSSSQNRGVTLCTVNDRNPHSLATTTAMSHLEAMADSLPKDKGMSRSKHCF